MAVIIPVVDVPDPIPKPQRYGLFTAATGPLDLPVHARGGGIRWRDDTTVLPAGFEILCAPSTVTFADGCGSWITGRPFAVQATMATGSIGVDQEQIRQTLMTRLVAGEQAVVEQIFSEGLFGQLNSLSNNTVAPTALAAAASVRRAFGQLDEFLSAHTGLRCIIHAPAVVASYLDECGVTRVAGRLETPLGTIVSIGNYSGKSPIGGAPAAGHTYLYGCMSTVVYRTPDSEMFISPYEANLDLGAFNSRTPDMQNQIAAVARREYVVTHNNVFASIDATIA